MIYLCYSFCQYDIECMQDTERTKEENYCAKIKTQRNIDIFETRRKNLLQNCISVVRHPTYRLCSVYFINKLINLQNTFNVMNPFQKNYSRKVTSSSRLYKVFV